MTLPPPANDPTRRSASRQSPSAAGPSNPQRVAGFPVGEAAPVVYRADGRPPPPNVPPTRTARPYDQGPRKSRWRWLRRLAVVVAVFLGIAIVAVATLQIRLSDGPIDIPQLVTPIENGLEREFGGTQVRIDSVALYRAEPSRRLEFRLSNLRLLDETGATVVRVPTAAIDISRNALINWNIAPKRIDLIRPRLVLSYNDDAGLSLRFGGFQASSAATAAAANDVPPQPVDDAADEYAIAAPPGSKRDVSLVRVLQDTFQAARERRASTSFLRSVGVRNAVVVLRTRTTQTVWSAPDLSLALRHRSAQSLIRGKGTITDGVAPWQFAFEIDDTPALGAFQIRTLFEGLIPGEFGRAVPQLAGLRAIETPLSGKADFELLETGALARANVDVVVGAGHITATPDDTANRMLVDEGQVKFAFDAARGAVRFDTLDLLTSDGRMVLAGEVGPAKGVSGGVADDASGKRWAFDLAGNMRMKADKATVAPLSEVAFKGVYMPSSAELRVDRMNIAWPEVQIAGRGSISPTKGITVSGQIGETSKAGLLSAWPPEVARDARDYMATSVQTPLITGGQFSLSLPSDVRTRMAKGGDIPAEALAFDLSANDLQVSYLDALPTLQFPKATLSIRGRTLRVKSPAGFTQLEKRKK
ncbi:MAG: hypothetical protein AAGJ70_12165, partial [Pseudomonadota bacterium]